MQAKKGKSFLEKFLNRKLCSRILYICFHPAIILHVLYLNNFSFLPHIGYFPFWGPLYSLFLLESLFSFLWQIFVVWFCKRHAFLNILPHCAQTNVFSTRFFKWIFKWVLRLLFCVKHLPHVMHSWGLMSVWMSWCFFKLYFNANVLPHKSHLWDFSPLWVSMCLLNFAISVNPWPHSTQENGRSPRWFIKQTSAYKGKELSNL